MDDVLPWDIQQDASAPSHAASDVTPPATLSTAALTAPSAGADDGALDWLGDLGGAPTTSTEANRTSQTRTDMTTAAHESSAAEAPLRDAEDPTGQTGVTARTEVGDAAHTGYPTETIPTALTSTTSVDVARDIQSALDTDVTHTSPPREDTPARVTSPSRTAPAPSAAHAPTAEEADAAPLTAPVMTSDSTTAAAPPQSGTHASRAANGTAANSSPSSRRHSKASKASESQREILTAVIREGSEPGVRDASTLRSGVASQSTRQGSRADAPCQAIRSGSTRFKSGRRGPRLTATGKGTGGPTYTRENFFFAGDDIGTEFGMGTTGLYASKNAPVASIDKSRTVPAPTTATTTRIDARGSRSGADRGQGSSAAPRGSPRETSYTSAAAAPGPDGGRAYFTSAFYTKVPEGYHENQWARRREAFDDWRTAQLQRSTYFTFGKSVKNNATDGSAPSHHEYPCTQKDGDTPAGAEVSDEPRLDPVSLYTAEEVQAFERRRTVAIAAERRAKVKARETETAQHEAALASQHQAYHQGVPTYLPDAYYRTTLEHEQVTQLPGNHLTCSDPRAVITPRDHHKAQVAYRQYQSQLAADRVAVRQRAAKMYNARIEKEAAQSREELAHFHEAWLEGLPHLSREGAMNKTQSIHEAQRERARLNAADVKYNREVYALYRDLDEAAHREHLSYLRTKLPVSSQERLHAIREKSARQEEAPAAKPQTHTGDHATAAVPRTPAPPPAKPPSAPSPPPPASAPPAAAISAAPAPVPIPLPARTFVSEVRQWQDTFQSPNVVPPTTQDPDVRRQWLRRLSDERRAFKKDTVELGKEQPVRVQQAVVNLFEQRVKTADGQRKEDASLKERKLEVLAENHAYATALHEQNKDILEKGRQVRQEMVADRQVSALAQRQRERDVDVLMSTLEKEELQRLKQAVMSARS